MNIYKKQLIPDEDIILGQYNFLSGKNTLDTTETDIKNFIISNYKQFFSKLIPNN
jgi:hypothetical protein